MRGAILLLPLYAFVDSVLEDGTHRWYRNVGRKLPLYAAQHPRRVKIFFFNCCLSVQVDNYTIIIPTKCTSFLLLKAQDITICTFLSVF
jgi:hypothetical protein